MSTEDHTKKVVEIADGSEVTYKGKVLPATAWKNIKSGDRIRVWSCRDDTRLALVEVLSKASASSSVE
jgi:hypothetical protein